jgi:hypothetical protein
MPYERGIKYLLEADIEHVNVERVSCPCDKEMKYLYTS